MEKYRVYSHGPQKCGLGGGGGGERLAVLRATGFNDFVLDIFALQKIKTIYTTLNTT